jgi:hypothetical protein
MFSSLLRSTPAFVRALPVPGIVEFDIGIR